MGQLRVRFFKKIQNWILKSERIRKRILCFSTKQINPRSLGSWCIKGTEESTLEMDSSVPLTHHDPRDLGLICLIEKHKIRFRILSDLRIQFWIFLKKRTLRNLPHNPVLFTVFENVIKLKVFVKRYLNNVSRGKRRDVPLNTIVLRYFKT